ncbi:Methionine synthase [Diplonema papillatum]|nr:Methionine synthase [Diplonema papillatum]
MALSVMRLVEGVTGLNILGLKDDDSSSPLQEEDEGAGDDPWARWRVLEAEVLKPGGVVILDGATGSEIERLAGPDSMNELGWSCSANFTYPDVVTAVHESYLDSGADLIISNTYCTNGNVMQAAGLGSIAERSTRAAVKHAKKARRHWLGRNPGAREPLIAGSLSCHPPKQAPGSAFDGGEWQSDEIEIENDNKHARLLAECGVDIIFCEMVWDTEHGERAVKAACDTGLPVAVCFSIPVPDHGNFMGAVKSQLAANAPLKLGGFGDTTLAEAAQRLTAGRPNIVALCIHHTPLLLMPHAIAAVRSVWSGYLGAYPEHGSFEMPHWNYEALDTDEFVGHAEVWTQSHRVQMVGGCCGVGPKFIEALANTFKRRNPSPPPRQAPAPRTPDAKEESSQQPPAAETPPGSSLPPPPERPDYGDDDSPAAAAAKERKSPRAALPPPPSVHLLSSGDATEAEEAAAKERKSPRAALPPPPSVHLLSSGDAAEAEEAAAPAASESPNPQLSEAAAPQPAAAPPAAPVAQPPARPEVAPRAPYAAAPSLPQPPLAYQPQPLQQPLQQQQQQQRHSSPAGALAAFAAKADQSLSPGNSPGAGDRGEPRPSLPPPPAFDSSAFLASIASPGGVADDDEDALPPA